MPIFEFHCQSCDKTFEKLLKSAVKQAPCPSCGRQAQRVVSTPSVGGHQGKGCSAPAGSGFG
jgi:putative FmdB family regulatory protein